MTEGRERETPMDEAAGKDQPPSRPDDRAQKREKGSPDRSWALTSLPWPEVGRALAPNPRLLFPVGALVQHGPHLPLGTNTLIAEAVGGEVSRRTGIPLAPAFHYGVRAPERDRSSGSAGLQRKTMHRAMNELLADWEDHGIKEFILLSAHRYEPHLDALLMAMTSSAVLTVVSLSTIEVTDLLEGPPLQEYGGELETSLMLHLHPERVRLDQITDHPADPRPHRRYARGGAPTPPPGSRGILGFPSRATAGKGEAVFRRYVEALLELLGVPEEPDAGGPGLS